MKSSPLSAIHTAFLAQDYGAALQACLSTLLYEPTEARSALAYMPLLLQRLGLNGACLPLFAWQDGIFSLPRADRVGCHDDIGLVSVITVVKDLVAAGRMGMFLKMLDSVQEQTWPQEKIEHLVVDGASTDGTPEFLERLLAEGKIQALVSKPDTGVYEAMNRGLCQARGDAMLFLNSDDALEPQALELLVQGIVRQGVDYAYADVLRYDESGEVVGTHVGNGRAVFFGTPYCHQTLLCRKRCYAVLRYDEHFQITEWPLCVKLHEMGFTALHVPERLVRFRVGGKSCTGTPLAVEQRVIQKYMAFRLGLDLEEYLSLAACVRLKNLHRPLTETEENLLRKCQKHGTLAARMFVNMCTLDREQGS
ncbi:MAG: glycosyltransferase [Desulfovibrio sp.]|nr:glycosyltransferase [Desulfovibrio sp.]